MRYFIRPLYSYTRYFHGERAIRSINKKNSHFILKKRKQTIKGNSNSFFLQNYRIEYNVFDFLWDPINKIFAAQNNNNINRKLTAINLNKTQ